MVQLASIHLFVTAALVGLIWVVQLVVYPALQLVDERGFAAYHSAHMQRITWVVAPLMLTEVATLALVLAYSGYGSSARLASAAALVAVWASTAFVQVPLHTQLRNCGKDNAVIARLVASNWLRTVLWSARGALVLGCGV